MTSVSDSTARWLGLALGVGLAVVALLAWRVPADGPGLGADVRLVAVPPGELSVAPTGTFLTGRRLRPGARAAGGQLTVRNLAGRPVAVAVRGLPSSRELDRQVEVSVRAGAVTLARGTLATLRRWSPRTVVVPPRGSTRLRASAWLTRSASGYEGRSVDVTVELRAR